MNGLCFKRQALLIGRFSILMSGNFENRWTCSSHAPRTQNYEEHSRGCDNAPSTMEAGGAGHGPIISLWALIRHGCHRKVDPEDALQYIVFNMLSGTGEKGQRRKSLFDFDENRPVDLQQGNPLEVLFKIYLGHSLRSVCSGKIARVITIHRPTGTISIGQGYEDKGTISADAIPDRPQTGEQEMLEDIFMLLKKRSTPGIDLAGLFQSILNQEGTRVQRQKFGHNAADWGRKIIVKTITDYAHQTQNWHLLNLLDKFKDFTGSKADPSRQRQRKGKPRPKLSSDPIERDYQSIVGLVQQLGGKLTTPKRAAGGGVGQKENHATRHRYTQIGWPTRSATWFVMGFSHKNVVIRAVRSTFLGRISPSIFPRQRPARAWDHWPRLFPGFLRFLSHAAVMGGLLSI